MEVTTAYRIVTFPVIYSFVYIGRGATENENYINYCFTIFMGDNYLLA